MIDKFKVIVSSVIFDDEGKVLLGKRSMNEDMYPGLWGIPGGKIEVEDSDDNTIELTLKREAIEEMGIEIEPTSYIASNTKVADGKGKLYIIFLSKYASGEPKCLEDTDEVRWFEIEDLEKIVLTPRTYDNILMAKKMLTKQ